MEEEHEVEKTTEVVSSQPEHVVRTTRKVMKEPAVQTEHPQKVYAKKKTIFRYYQIIWYIVGVIEVLLVFRFLLKMIGANSSFGFTSFIYAISSPFAGPFLGVVSPSVSGTSILEWSTIIAMLVYVVIAYGLVYLFQLVKPVTPEEVEHTVDAT